MEAHGSIDFGTTVIEIVKQLGEIKGMIEKNAGQAATAEERINGKIHAVVSRTTALEAQAAARSVETKHWQVIAFAFAGGLVVALVQNFIPHH